MIELRNVSAGYNGRQIIKNINLSFKTGKVTVILGPNGCGKSTLIKTALGLIPKSEGKILYDDTEISSMKPREIAHHAAYLSQSRNVPHITAGKMVLHGRFPYLGYPRKYRQEDYEAVRKAMQQADCLQLSSCRMEQLSGGQRQKIYLAMALAQNTETVFMDEPTTFLDVRHQLETMEVAESLAADGKAAVLVLHDLGLALKTADEAVLMDEGKILQAGSPVSIFESGRLGEVFGVRVCRVAAENGWQYYCEACK